MEKWNIDIEVSCHNCGKKYMKSKKSIYCGSGLCRQCGSKRKSPIGRKESLRKYNSSEKRKNTTRRFYLNHKNNPAFKLNRLISLTIRQNINKNGERGNDILEYNINDLIHHLEKQFDDKMNGDNHGSYGHIDHIRPISSFVFLDEKGEILGENVKQCWSLNNLQPLEAKENLRKGAKGM